MMARTSSAPTIRRRCAARFRKRFGSKRPHENRRQPRPATTNLPTRSSIEADGVRWSNGAFRPADAIIWSTGFRPELRHLAPLKLREKSGGIVVGKNVSWKNPRLFFAGYGPTASTIGANRAGRAIARQVVATLSNLASERRSAPTYELPTTLADTPEARFLDD